MLPNYFNSLTVKEILGASREQKQLVELLGLQLVSCFDKLNITIERGFKSLANQQNNQRAPKDEADLHVNVVQENEDTEEPMLEDDEMVMESDEPKEEYEVNKNICKWIRSCATVSTKIPILKLIAL